VRIAGVHWTSKVNILIVNCICGEYFQHRVDRWKVYCPKCKQSVSVFKLRQEYCNEKLARLES